MSDSFPAGLLVGLFTGGCTGSLGMAVVAARFGATILSRPSAGPVGRQRRERIGAGTGGVLHAR